MHDLLQLILRQREDDRDRLQLRDDDKARRIGGVNDVALFERRELDELLGPIDPETESARQDGGAYRANRQRSESQLQNHDIVLMATILRSLDS